MDIYRISGGKALAGSVRVQGAKNAILPILASTVLLHGETVIHNCPRLTDVEDALCILRHLGCTVTMHDDTITVNADNISKCDIPENMMRKMRSSVIFLGAVAGRCGKAKLSLPGGCELGPRPVDLHIHALCALGADIEQNGNEISCVSPKLCGGTVYFPTVSVGATENAILAAVTAKGTTVIKNAACEPEIIDLQFFLNKCGAKIHGAGTREIVIEGIACLNGTEYTVMPDRIVGATYMAAVLSAGGYAHIRGITPYDVGAFCDTVRKTGAELVQTDEGSFIKAPKVKLSAGYIETAPYPGFPTDTQPLLMAAILKSNGETVIKESVFENRLSHAETFCRMGADIRIKERCAVIRGVDTLHGTKADAHDLRAGAAIVCAALGADGETLLSGVEFIDRGYEKLEENLAALGCEIVRITE